MKAETSRDSAQVRRESSATRILFCGVTLLALLLLTPRSSLLVYLFPAFAVLVGFLLLRLSTGRFVSFVVWLWILTPWVRRVVDFRAGTSASVVLLAPYLASSVPAVMFLRNRSAILRSGSAPLLYMAVAVFYGFGIGLSHFGPASVLQGLLTWAAPLCFAIFLYQNRAKFDEVFRAFEGSMIYGTLAAGTYGVVQYFVMPKWDALWMDTLGNVTFGLPEPMQVRVFSTMNAPQVLALFLAVGILLALRSDRRIRFLAVPAGTLALAFSMARTAWVSLLVGLAYLLSKASTRLRAQIVASALASFVLFGIALQDPRVRETVSQRFSTLSDVGHDDSFVARLEGHEALFTSIGEYPFGLGLGGQANGNDKEAKESTVGRGGKYMLQNDSTLAAVVISLGGAGSLLTGMVFVLLALRVISLSSDAGSYGVVLRMMVLVLAAETLFDNIVNGPCGFLSWAVLGLCLACPKEISAKRSRFSGVMVASGQTAQPELT